MHHSHVICTTVNTESHHRLGHYYFADEKHYTVVGQHKENSMYKARKNFLKSTSHVIKQVAIFRHGLNSARTLGSGR